MRKRWGWLHTCALVFLIFGLVGPAVVGCSHTQGPSVVELLTPPVIDFTAMDEATSPDEALFAARAQYAVLLAYANAYVTSPTADEDVVEAIREADEQVQRVEGMARTAITTGVGDVNQQLILLRSALVAFRTALLAGGL